MNAASTTDFLGVRYDAAHARGGHVESWFLKANDPRGRRAVWLKATIYAGKREPRAALGEAWAIAFDAEREHVAVKTSVPFERARFGEHGLDVAVDDCVWSPGRSKGRIETGGRTIAWDLSFDAHGVPLVHFPRAFLYEGPFPTSKLVSPLPDIRVSGSLEVNGEPWTLEAWPGLLGHNWGRRHAHLYGWGHCNVWDQPEELVIEGVSARVKLGPVLSPMTTVLCVRHRGVRYDINGLADLARNRGAVTPRRWAFRGKNALCELEGELWGETDDFVGLYYPNPDGSMCHCLNTKIAHAKVKLTVRGRAPLVVTSRAAALEIGTRDPHHGVRMYV
jgi:hypothetical protein